MAYHIGRVLHQYFGAEVFVVGAKPENVMFSYPIDFPVIARDSFEKSVAEEDLFICNPSFSSELFGLRLPCRKISYIQGIRTFAILDVFFDHYVFVSKFARDFIKKYYGIKGNVIPAFVHTDLFSCSDDGPARKTSIPITHYKYDDVVFTKFKEVFAAKYPDCPLEFEKYPVLPQHEFAGALRKHKYYLSLSCMEGFGLPMLEAMSSGCVAVGWDAGGSSEYARHGRNCMIARYGDFEALADYLYLVLNNHRRAEKLAQKGFNTSRKFDIKRFDNAWIKELSSFLSR
ncbi:MAG: glycosyltransferase [Desulfobulbaceae bacterium]|nr:glycosyltransferase [Desulfobulbaceae bacterium]